MTAATGFGLAHADEVDVPLDKLPKAVADAVKQKYPKAELVKATQDEEDDDEKVVKTVTDETKVVDGIECRVVEERETKNGKLVEFSRNYFAISKRTGCVYYFGEDVDDYKNDKIVGHHGTWLAGKDGAQFGLIMPGVPLIYGRFYQEVAPNVAEDRAEIIALGVSIKTPAGQFRNCVKMEETTPLEPNVKEYKVYAPGVGCVQDGDLKLVKYGKVELPKKN